MEVREGTLPESVAETANYAWDEEATRIRFELPYFTSYSVEVTDEITYLTLHQTQGRDITGFEGPASPEEDNTETAAKGAAAGIRSGGPLFSALPSGRTAIMPSMNLPNRKTGRIYGYTIEYDEEAGFLTFTFRHPP